MSHNEASRVVDIWKVFFNAEFKILMAFRFRSLNDFLSAAEMNYLGFTLFLIVVVYIVLEIFIDPVSDGNVFGTESISK